MKDLVRRLSKWACLACSLTFVVNSAIAQDADQGDLARQLANPVSSLISVPIQANYDSDFGPDDAGSVLRINFQPVIPMGISEDWNLISRTILPLVDQRSIMAGGADRSGLGDTVQSFVFSPEAPSSSGWIWGAGDLLEVIRGIPPAVANPAMAVPDMGRVDDRRLATAVGPDEDNQPSLMWNFPDGRVGESLKIPEAYLANFHQASIRLDQNWFPSNVRRSRDLRQNFRRNSAM